MPYAVIRTGGKQYRVAEGQDLRIEKIGGETGEEVEFAEVLMVERDGKVEIDPKKLAEFKVKGKILRHGRGTKIHVVKFKRRKGHHKRIGHRQDFTEVRISSLP